MTKVHKISIALTQEHYEMIQKAVASGDYATTSEVIRDALRGWAKVQMLRQMERERLCRLWDEGIASGPGRERSIEDIIAEAREAPLDGPAVMDGIIAKLADRAAE